MSALWAVWIAAAVVLLTGQVHSRERSACDWLHAMRSSGLTLNQDELISLQGDVRSLAERKMAVAAKYDHILLEIVAYRDSLSREYLRCTADTTCQQAILHQATIALETIVMDILVPVWLGGEWTFTGHSSRPQRGSIACGWFVERILTHAGLNIITARGQHIAYLSSDQEVWSYAGMQTPDLGNWPGLREFVVEHGCGLYVIGVSAGSIGHMLFLHYNENDRLLLYHSGISPNGTLVACDDAEWYLTEFFPPDHVWATKLESQMAYKWVAYDVIVHWSSNYSDHELRK